MNFECENNIFIPFLNGMAGKYMLMIVNQKIQY